MAIKALLESDVRPGIRTEGAEPPDTRARAGARGTVSTVGRVVVEQAIMGEVPCIAGTRILVVPILGLLGDDMPIT